METANAYEARMARQYEEARRADELRQRKAAAADQKRQEIMAKDDRAAQARAAESDPGRGEPKSFRQRVMAARRNLNAGALKEKAKEKVKGLVTAPASAATGRALQWAWYTLIPSWGLTLIYINIHVFGRMVLGEKFFCKLGHEWIPAKAQAVAGEAGKTVGRMAGIVEVMVLLILDLLVLFIILGVLGIIALIVNFMGASWWEKLEVLWEAIRSLGWSNFIKPMIDLFSI